MNNISKVLSEVMRAFPILKELREKYGINWIGAGDTQLKELIKSDENIDLQAVHKDLEEWVYKFGVEFLPSDLAAYKKIIDYQKSLPPEPIYTEPITVKLKQDVDMLYKAHLHVVNLLVSSVAAPWQAMIDNIFSSITDNLFEILLTGETRDIPSDNFGSVKVQNMFGVDVVVAIASGLTDPKTITEEFYNTLIEKFGTDRPNITETNLETAKYLGMKFEGFVIKDIADEYIQEHRKEFPDDPESDEYRAKKRSLEDRLETNMRRLDKTILEIFKEQET